MFCGSEQLYVLPHVLQATQVFGAGHACVMESHAKGAPKHWHAEGAPGQWYG
jgi:hypothetical protein